MESVAAGILSIEEDEYSRSNAENIKRRQLRDACDPFQLNVKA